MVGKARKSGEDAKEKGAKRGRGGKKGKRKFPPVFFFFLVCFFADPTISELGKG